GSGGYFPKGRAPNGGVGCVSGPGADLPRRREALVSALRAAGRLPAGLTIEPFRGHAYVVRRRAPRRLAGDRFCLVGDAAGLARDLIGEGVGPAVKSGILAAAAGQARLSPGAAVARPRRPRRAPRWAPASRATRPPSCGGTDRGRPAGSAGSSRGSPIRGRARWCARF